MTNSIKLTEEELAELSEGGAVTVSSPMFGPAGYNGEILIASPEKEVLTPARPNLHYTDNDS